MRRVRILVVLSAVVSTPRFAWAGGGAATDAYEGIGDETLELHGLLDLYAQHDFQQPASGQVLYREFDFATGPSVGLARLTLAHQPDPLGFRLDVGFGDVPNAYMQSDPAATQYPAYARGMSYLLQAFVTVRPPPVPQLAVDVGKFSTPVGFEDNESITNWNYSRSLLFTLAEPTYQTGLRATYGRSEGFAVSAFWLNGWNANFIDGDQMRSFAAAAKWSGKGKDSTEVALVYLAGPERAPTQLANPTESFRQELDGYVSTSIWDRVDVAATGDYGRDLRNGGVSWWGVSGYLRYRFTPWLALPVRGEYLSDADGFLTGTRQRLWGVTGGLQVQGTVGPFHLVGWLEYRHDHSDEAVFPSGATQLVFHQDTVTLAGAAAF
jgi:hypothetical protein